MPVQILTGDSRVLLTSLPDESVNCIVTSPPYYGLRNYGVDGQIGLEKSPSEYVLELASLFSDAKRVLRKDGTLWLNLGDSYKDKQLLGIPWRVAFALQADGWFLRSSIIWHKQNPMPEAVKDRPTNCHENLFLLTKSARYHYDAEAVKEAADAIALRPQKLRARELAAEKGLTPEHLAAIRSAGVSDVGKAQTTQTGFGKNTEEVMRLAAEAKAALGGYYREFVSADDGRNLRNVWTFASKPYKAAHFATFPPALVEPCIKAGCPVGGTVLDPFGGSGTTGLVARSLGRNAILMELNPAYVLLARERLGIPDESPPTE